LEALAADPAAASVEAHSKAAEAAPEVEALAEDRLQKINMQRFRGKG
jgi:hypothetical protein